MRSTEATTQAPTADLIPVVDDPDTGGFFAAAAEHRLVVQACATCGNRQQPPRPRCVACQGTDLAWEDVPGTGTVHSWTVVEHQVNPHFPAPYTVLLVDVQPGPGAGTLRYLGHLPGRPAVHIGSRVQVAFEERADGVTIPNWQLDEH